MSSAKVSNGPLHIFDYPIYAVDVVGNSSVVVAGGGGASKTGVPNRLDVVLINKGRNSHYLSLGDEGNVSASIRGGCETGTEAVMSLSVMNSGGGSFITTLEGRKCVEYLASLRKTVNPSHADDNLASLAHQDHVVDKECSIRHRQHKGQYAEEQPKEVDVSREPSDSQQYWELIKLREFSMSPSLPQCTRGGSGRGAVANGQPGKSAMPTSGDNNRPTCVANGGSGAASFVAVGTENGSVFHINRHSTESLASLLHGDMRLLAVHVDVSGGHSAGVSCLSLSSLKTTAEGSDWPLLATVCDQPDWVNLRIWHSPTQSLHTGTDDKVPILPASANLLYAVASCSTIPNLSSFAPAATKADSNTASATHRAITYRFKHGQFMHYNYRPSTSSKSGTHRSGGHVLATTVQPLRAGHKSYSHLIVWLIPEPASHSPRANSALGDASPLQLASLAEIALPQGHMPACMTVHPSQSRALIGVGTMDGRVDVYFLSPWDHKLSRVYSLANAHPIFVTALSFLPSVAAATKPGDSGEAASDSFQLVSVSVDRLLLWHPGPDYFQIACLARGQPDPKATIGLVARLTPGRWRLSYLISFVICVVVLLPVYVIVLDALLSRWL